jgi:hypothetical protein
MIVDACVQSFLLHSLMRSRQTNLSAQLLRISLL